MNVEKNESYKGQCLCGSIQYEVKEIEPKINHCHCSMCRKFHGSAFATFAKAKSINFNWTEGYTLLKTFVAPNGTKRKFCENCGSSLIFESPDHSNELVEFSLGTLDSKIDLKPDAHIFVKSCANWHKITDNLPQFAEDRE